MKSVERQSDRGAATHEATRVSWKWRPQVLVYSALLIVATSAPAHAMYVDPGSGALLLQVILAGCAGVIYAFRTAVWNLLRPLFRGGGDENSDENR